MVLDVYQAKQMPLAAVWVAAVLTLLCVAGAVAKGHRGLWAAAGVSLLVFVTLYSAWKKPARKLLRLTPEGFYTYRLWKNDRPSAYRVFTEESPLFRWSQFTAVTLEERSARFGSHTRERVLRLKPAGEIDRMWSHDYLDPDFLVEASEQSVEERELLRRFQQALKAPEPGARSQEPEGR